MKRPPVRGVAVFAGAMLFIPACQATPATTPIANPTSQPTAAASALPSPTTTATPTALPTPTTLPTQTAGSSPTTAAPSISPATPSAVPATGTWTTTGSLITGRAEHTATLLPDGKVLVAGGVPDNTEQVQLASAELYDPSTGKWSSTGAMQTPRSKFTATLLANGKVLVAGGFCDPNTTKGCPQVEDPDGAIAEAELYDPRAGTWSPTGSMTTERFLHTATLLADGKVLVAGAEHRDAILASTDLYDPSTGKWTATGSMITARTQQFSAKLGDGKVLMAGGIGPVSPTDHGVLASAEVYDPGTGEWSATGGLITAREQTGTAALLGDGRVLLAGGGAGGDQFLATAELYEPSTGTWSATASMIGPRTESSATVLANGRVFVVGGFPGVPDGLLASAELFDPQTGSWIAAGSMSIGRFDLTATLLANNQVLVAGGLLPDGVASTAELYDPASGS